MPLIISVLTNDKESGCDNRLKEKRGVNCVRCASGVNGTSETPDAHGQRDSTSFNRFIYSMPNFFEILFLTLIQ